MCGSVLVVWVIGSGFIYVNSPVIRKNEWVNEWVMCIRGYFIGIATKSSLCYAFYKEL